MNLAQLSTIQQTEPARIYNRERTEAVLEQPTSQVTRRTDRQLSQFTVGKARFAFSASLRGAQLTQQAAFEPRRMTLFISYRRPSFALAQGNHLPPYSSMIADFITANRVGDARALLAAASQGHQPIALMMPNGPQATADLRAWSIVLAEPNVTPRTDSCPTATADFDWLREHAVDYKNRWVAIRGGVLLAEGESLRDLIAILDHEHGRAGVLVHKL